MNNFESIVGHFSAFLLMIQRLLLPPNDFARLDITPAPLELLLDHAEE